MNLDSAGNRSSGADGIARAPPERKGGGYLFDGTLEAGFKEG